MSYSYRRRDENWSEEEMRDMITEDGFNGSETVSEVLSPAAIDLFKQSSEEEDENITGEREIQDLDPVDAVLVGRIRTIDAMNRSGGRTRNTDVYNQDSINPGFLEEDEKQPDVIQPIIEIYQRLRELETPLEDIMSQLGDDSPKLNVVLAAVSKSEVMGSERNSEFAANIRKIDNTEILLKQLQLQLSLVEI